VKAGGSDQDMGHAIEGGANERGAGAPSSYRRSYSSSIYVDHEDRANMITHFAERMFPFVRRMTGYEVYSPGQESINAVLYKNVGDENRPHCDGSCEGQRYVLGERVATSPIVNCDVPKVDGKRHLRGQGLWCFVEEDLPCFIRGEPLLNPVDKVAGY
jgi:hypothetical protein